MKRQLWFTVLVLGLSVSPVPPASAADTADAQVPNGTFAQPVAPDNGTAAGHPDWAPDNNTGAVFGKTLAQHPLGYQAATLNWNGAALSLRTRLWGVKAGSGVTLSWDDSPGVYAQCTADQLKDGQTYNVSLVAPGPVQDPVVTTKGTDTVGTANWTTGRAFSFTATEDNPMVSFDSQEKRASLSCGPLITNVTAKQTPAPVDQKITKEQLPGPKAYRGNEPLEPGVAVDDCEGSAANCTFTVDSRYSYRYYGQTRVVGEVYLNCTRNPIVDDRRIEVTEPPYDNLTQYYALKGAPLVPSRSDLSQSRPNLAAQAAAGYAAQGGNAAAVSTSNPLTWSRTSTKSLNPTIQPGEVSWIEVQPARERVVGSFTNSRNKYRLDATFDLPAVALPDRYFQRTGPLTEVELQRCGAARPTAGTPDNGANPDKRLLTLDAPPTWVRTRTLPLSG
ncbi:hypothetical protein CFP65_0912 [Kitasatospora sp. MMS16-BH015]|uniref:hypothetical protein n=1 Tax=Kitasatospora sp. MMS16-BH015 TaxID=2018025 RepID=UPI000CA35960|nr:hypothetical protein [Kitasatospora sp. MMS16-BH015]AUG75833.1 hypothetical protein CFP65_0912 [Kitasatospora sp. MMS16-BH015]